MRGGAAAADAGFDDEDDDDEEDSDECRKRVDESRSLGARVRKRGRGRDEGVLESVAGKRFLNKRETAFEGRIASLFSRTRGLLA